MAMNKEREYRNFNEIRQMQEGAEEDKKEYIVEGYATTFNDPYLLYDDGTYKVYEQIDSKAFEGADMSDVLFLYNHEGRVFARQKNGTLQLSVDEKGLHIIADLSSTEESRKMYEDIKAGLVDQMSWAFTVGEETYDKQKKLRTITKVRKVYDCSCVSIPANPNTSIASRSFLDGVIEEERRSDLEREKMVLMLRIKAKM